MLQAGFELGWAAAFIRAAEMGFALGPYQRGATGRAHGRKRNGHRAGGPGGQVHARYFRNDFAAFFHENQITEPQI